MNRQVHAIAIFHALQFDGGGKAFALFNVVGDHKLAGSTVGIETLQKEGIRVSWEPKSLQKLENELVKMAQVADGRIRT